MEKKQKKRKKFLLSILFLLATLALLSTSTYAWFTANKVVKVSEIQVNVEAQGGIQISADGTNWKSVVSVPDLTSVHNTTYQASVNQIPDTLKATSTVKTVDSTGKMEMFAGTIVANETTGDNLLTAVKDTEQEGTTGSFIAFDLFFKADNDTQLYLTPNSQIKTADAEDTGIKNAARIAFVNLGNTPIGSNLQTIQALNAGTAANVYLWEPNYDVHTAPGVQHAHDVYNKTVTQTGNANPLEYSGVKKEITKDNNVLESAAVGDTEYVKTITPDYKTKDNFDQKLKVFSLQKGITKIRLYMWIEGQDVDCENLASGGSALFNVQLSSEA